MSHCFISYRHVAPDQELAHALSTALQHSGHMVFLDGRIEVGARWVEAIEREISASAFFTVLLSEQSIRSDMVRQEIALAHERASADKLCILPVRVAFTAALPYDLAAYLNPLQHAHWNPGEPFDRVCSEIVSAIDHRCAAHAQPDPPRPAAVQFDTESLNRLTRELAAFVGPVARVLVNRAAKQAQSLEQLRAALAAEIPAEDQRRLFLVKHASP